MMRNTLTMAFLGCVVAVAAGCATAPYALDRGIGFYRDGDFFLASTEFNRAVYEDPTSVDAYVNRGVARMRLGRVNDAIDDYNRAIQLSNRDPEIYFDRGNALVAAAQYDLAAEDYTRAVELSPTFARAWFNRGSALALAGRTDAARRDWVQAIAVESDPWARAAMSRSAAIDKGPAVAGVPTTERTVAPPPSPGMATDAVPLQPRATLAAAVPATPAASPPPSPESVDARALATRAVSRHLDGDRVGAQQDLNAAIAMEKDPARRASLENLRRMLETAP